MDHVPVHVVMDISGASMRKDFPPKNLPIVDPGPKVKISSMHRDTIILCSHALCTVPVLLLYPVYEISIHGDGCSRRVRNESKRFEKVQEQHELTALFFLDPQ